MSRKGKFLKGIKVNNEVRVKNLVKTLKVKLGLEINLKLEQRKIKNKFQKH